jgi:SSS family solute:Na+ symporter
MRAALLAADDATRLDAHAVDYSLLVVYFALVLGIGFLARRQVASSLDFLLSGRSLPAWVTGLAFISANLGALELLGMAANGAQYGVPTVHYYWIGAIPAMVFLGIVMMPFYYGSKVRSVPEFLLRRFNKTTQRVQAVAFAVASLLIAGVNLYALAVVMQALLGWSLVVSVVVAAAVVLSYTTLGGLSAAIYNEVLQFFVIVAALVPITVAGLNRVGGWDGLTEKILVQEGGGPDQVNAWPATNLTEIGSSTLSVMGLVFGLGFVLSFGYWTTNFAEVQRAMSAKSMSAARRTPLIGAFPKALFPFIIIVPGMVGGVLIPQLADLKAGGDGDGVTYTDTLPLLMGELLPNGVLGVAIAGLLASFMAGMAANISSFNTVFTYDIWEDWIRPGREDRYYLNVGRAITVIGTVIAVFTAFIASGYTNIMDYIQTLFSFFNAPLFATFILGLFWKRMTGTAGWTGLVSGIAAAVVVDRLVAGGVLELSGQGGAFVGAGAAFVVDILVSVAVSLRTQPKPDEELRGLVWSLTPKAERMGEMAEDDHGWYRSPGVLGGGVIALTVILYILVG